MWRLLSSKHGIEVVRKNSAFLCLFASHTHRHILRHWPIVMEQEVESGQKLRDESCSARGSVCICVSTVSSVRVRI